MTQMYFLNVPLGLIISSLVLFQIKSSIDCVTFYTVPQTARVPTYLNVAILEVSLSKH